MGIGLSIVKHIVEEAHGGRVTVRSAPGTGQLEDFHPLNCRRGTENELNMSRILIIEDELPMRTALKDCLEASCIVPAVAADGEAGLKKRAVEKSPTSCCWTS